MTSYITVEISYQLAAETILSSTEQKCQILCVSMCPLCLIYSFILANVLFVFVLDRSPWILRNCKDFFTIFIHFIDYTTINKQLIYQMIMKVIHFKPQIASIKTDKYSQTRM